MLVAGVIEYGGCYNTSTTEPIRVSTEITGRSLSNRIRRMFNTSTTEPILRDEETRSKEEAEDASQETCGAVPEVSGLVWRDESHLEVT
ncbi:hypothetical protein J6590_045302 [Homalodisca vitripennis]|nr:hypothetical protein J6590_045302 [Homalodisca vitripennis]